MSPVRGRVGRGSPAPSAASSVWPRYARYARKLALAGAWLQIFLGIGWWWRNITTVPAYGDTVEYLELASTLRVDGYRTVAYPWLVHLARAVPSSASVPWQVYLYAVQLVVLALASVFLVRALSPGTAFSRQVLGAGVVTTSPLALHYATSVLTDSLAASFFVVALAGAARVAVHGDRRPALIAVTGAAALGTALLRTEKAAVLLVCAVLLVTVVLVVGRKSLRTVLPIVLTLGLTLVVPALAAHEVNAATQTAELGRPTPNLLTSAVSRVVWPHLSQIRGELDPTVQAAVSAEVAGAFDADNNQALPMVAELRALDHGGDRYTQEAVKDALGCCWRQVGTSTALDAAEYALTPVTFAVEGTTAIRSPEQNTVTAWDVSRFDAADPALTHLLIFVGIAELVLLTASSALSWRARARDERRRSSRVALVVYLGTVVNGMTFAALQGADANVRYGLSNVVAVVAVLATWGLVSSAAPTEAPTPPR